MQVCTMKYSHFFTLRTQKSTTEKFAMFVKKFNFTDSLFLYY